MEEYPASFSSVSWAPERQAYGILHLLRRRAVMCQDFPKPVEVAHLKFLCFSRPMDEPSLSASDDDLEDGGGGGGSGDSSGNGGADPPTPPPPPLPGQLPAERREAAMPPPPQQPQPQPQPQPLADPWQADAGTTVAAAAGASASRASGEDMQVVQALGRVGAWWHICSPDEVIVRQDVSIFSAELHRLRPGTWIQQAAPAEQFTRGPARGLVRLPVLPRGWVTADARSVGGPQYVEPAPRWCVVHGSGTCFGDVLVRTELALDSEELAVLTAGDVVDQAGPQETINGIVRMRILLPEWAAPPPPKSAEVFPDPASHAAASKAAAAAAAARRAAQRASAGGAPCFGWVTVDASPVGGPVFLERKGGWT